MEKTPRSGSTSRQSEKPRATSRQEAWGSKLAHAQDATAQHWTKMWGPGGSRMAQELRHLADEVHHMCLGEGGQWFPDMRMQRVHEKLLLMVEGVQKGIGLGFEGSGERGGGGGGGVQLPSIGYGGGDREYGGGGRECLPPITPPTGRPKTPPSVTKIENARLRTRLADSKVQITAMENTFASYVRARDLQKARQEWLHKYGLNGRYFAYDTAAVCRVFAAWAKKAMIIIRAKVCREMARRTVAFSLAEYNVALTQKVFGLWAVAPMIHASRKRIATTLGTWYERHQGEALESQIGLYFYLWQPHGAIYRLGKEIVDANVRAQLIIENAARAKRALLERFGALALAQLSRMIGWNDGATLEKYYHDWVFGVSLIKEERIRAKELAEAQERDRLKRLAAAEKAFGWSTESLKRLTIQALHDTVKHIRSQRAKWEHAMANATGRIMGGQAALKKDCFSAWAEDIRETKILRERADMEAAKRLLDEAKARAMKMLDKSREGNGEELVLPLFTCWRDAVVAERLKRAGKEHAFAMVLRKILNAEIALREICIGSWQQLVTGQKEKAAERLIYEIEAKTRFKGLAHNAVTRLNRRMGVMHVFEAWVSRSL